MRQNLKAPKEPILKQKHEFKILGKTTARLDLGDRLTGKAVYGLDVDVPGMVYACVLHSPMIFGKLLSFDDSETKKVAGVLHVLRCERTMIYRTTDSVAVIASNWWAAKKGRDVLKATWDNTGLAESLHNEEYFGRCYKAAQSEGIRFEESNDFKAKFNEANLKLDVTYETPFLSHVPIEPENATAHVKADGTVEIWAPLARSRRDPGGSFKVPGNSNRKDKDPCCLDGRVIRKKSLYGFYQRGMFPL